MKSIIAYVSDEMYLALHDAVAEFVPVDGGEMTILRSSPSGAFYAELPPGKYRVVLAKTGYGAKTTLADIGAETPVQFRLLSDGLLGYMWPKWVRAGEDAEFRVHSVEPYQLSLWRYGLRRELIKVVTWMDEHGPQANRQILPEGDFTQHGVGWNQVGYAARPTLTAPDRSGLYYLWARTPNGRAFSFPWIVAPRKPTARIAVLASTNTWNAYNNFGGRSNYVNADQLPPSPVINARQDLDRYQNAAPFGTWLPKDADYRPLSFDRPEPNNHLLDEGEPTDPVQGRTQCGQAPGEWRLYAWLEREGFDYDLYSEAQLHDGSLPLTSYDALIAAVHPEYWSRAMYTAVKDWVFQRGGHFMYLGGNGLNCEVIFQSGGAMRCLSHLHSQNGEMGGRSEDGSIEYDSRMHRTFESEANLLGVVTSETGIMTAAPFRTLDADHWVFTGTGLRNGDLFGHKTLHERIPGGASGHETDKRSRFSPAGTILLAKGTNPEDGGSEMVFYETGASGAVFSVGSITWVAALLVDDAVSRITLNVIRHFLSNADSRT